tara:strand:+ start:239 stop:679 length:441 start_codon:yes stop_codon:yes gene_type:complete
MSEEDKIAKQNTELLRMTSEIVSAYVANNPLPATEVPEVLNIVFNSLSSLETGIDNSKAAKPAVPIRRSINPDYIICLEDGKKLKMLKRHLRAVYGLSPEQYRAKWGLPIDYPMVAPNYARTRSEFAKRIGLGRKKNQILGPSVAR